MTRHPRHAALLAATTTLLLAAAAVPASAGSLVFVKDHNVWLAQPDGAKLTAVTTDGTADDPYRSLSQADDGTIAASHGQRILRMRQNGEVMNEIDPPPLNASLTVRLPQAKARRLSRPRTVTITVRAAGAAPQRVTLR